MSDKKRLLWINDDRIDESSLNELQNVAGEDFKVEISDLDYKNLNLDVIVEKLCEKIEEKNIYVLTDSEICGSKRGGFELLCRLSRDEKLARGMVISTDPYPRMDDREWAQNPSRIWRLNAESTMPNATQCAGIIRYLEEGIISFVEPAKRMLRRFESALRFLPSGDLGDHTSFLEYWRRHEGSIGSGEDMLSPFFSTQWNTGEVFPLSVKKLESDLGITISRKQRSGFSDALSDWRAILCPFESLKYATQWKPASLSDMPPIPYGGALRLLWEVARRPKIKEVKKFKTDCLQKLDSLQQEWIQIQMSQLEERIAVIHGDHHLELIVAASKEVSRALSIAELIENEEI